MQGENKIKKKQISKTNTSLEQVTLEVYAILFSEYL